MSAIKNAFHDQIEQMALFSHDSILSKNEAFEILDAEGVDEIKWDDVLNMQYAQWMYFNLK